MRARASVLALLALALGGCGGAKGGDGRPPAGAGALEVLPPVVEPEPAIVPGQLVLVRRDAWLASDVGDGAPRVRAYEAGEPGQALLFRVLERDGDIVEVETVTGKSAREETAPNCVDDVIERLDVYKLRLFVRRSDVLRVTAAPVNEEYPDGTGVALSGGVPLGPPRRRVGERLVYPALLPDAEVEVALLPSQVARSYATRGRDPRDSLLGGELARSTRKGAVLTLGGKLALEMQVRRQLEVVGRSQRGARWLVAVHARCALVHAMAAAGDLHPVPADFAMTGGGWSDGCSHARSARPGIKVYWADGRVAGEVIEEHQLCGTLTERLDLSCYRRELVEPEEGESRPEWSLEVCFKKSDL